MHPNEEWQTFWPEVEARLKMKLDTVDPVCGILEGAKLRYSEELLGQLKQQVVGMMAENYVLYTKLAAMEDMAREHYSIEAEK